MDALRNYRGSVLVYVTLLLMVLIMFIGLAFDTGQMTYLRIQAQRSTDAAALAGVAGLPKYNLNGSPDQIMARVTALNNSNRFKGQDASIAAANVEPVKVVITKTKVDVTPAAGYWDSNAVRVTKTYTTPLMLSGLFNGGIESPIKVTSTAVIQQRGRLPIVVYCTKINYLNGCPAANKEYLFKTGNDDQPEIAYTTWFKTDAQLPYYLNELVNNPDMNPWVTAGAEIQLQNNQDDGAMQAVKTKLTEHGETWCVYLPVVEGTYNNNQNQNGGGGSDQKGVLGFVPVLITKATPSNGGASEKITFQFNATTGCAPSYVSTIATLVR